MIHTVNHTVSTPTNYFKLLDSDSTATDSVHVYVSFIVIENVI